MSTTPRTDEATYPADCLGKTLVVNRDCAAALETELSDAEYELGKMLHQWAKKSVSNIELQKRAEKAEADTKRLDWIASRKSTELVYFAAAGWSIIKSNGGDLLCDQNIHNFRDAIDAAMKEDSK